MSLVVVERHFEHARGFLAGCSAAHSPFWLRRRLGGGSGVVRFGFLSYSCRRGFRATLSGEAFDIIGDVMWLVEVEPEVEQWIESLSVREFATVAAAVERLAEDGSRLRFPASRSGGDAMVSC